MAASHTPGKPGNGSANSNRSQGGWTAFVLEEGTRNGPVLVVDDDEATREMLRYLVDSDLTARSDAFIRGVTRSLMTVARLRD